ncbi:RNA polymerase sigma-H factor [Nymphon striatum]|nr:RNA polymerase sigma-H factor [Nymphon striatum]
MFYDAREFLLHREVHLTRYAKLVMFQAKAHYSFLLHLQVSIAESILHLDLLIVKTYCQNLKIWIFPYIIFGHSIYNRYYKAMYNTSVRIVKDSAEAEDVMQESFLNAFTKLHTFKGEVTFGAWLKRIVINNSIYHYRKQQKKNEVDLDDVIYKVEDNDGVVSDHAITELKAQKVMETMNLLKDNYRVSLTLYLIEGGKRKFKKQINNSLLMEKDNIDNLFDNLQGTFDMKEPQEGHQDRFLEKLKVSQGIVSIQKKKNSWWRPLSIAASVAILLGVGFSVFNTSTSIDQQVAEISPEVSQTQFYFASLIDEQVRELENESTPETKKIIDDTMIQLAKLDTNYKTLEQDLLNGGNSKLILSAMITNFQTLLPILLSAGDGKLKGKYTKEKTIKKEYDVNADALLKVSNSYGNLNLTSWEGNKVMIEVHIKTNGNNEEKVQKKLNEITVDFEASSSVVSAKTVFNNSRNSWGWGGNNKVNMQINYTIKLPIKNSVHLNNDYGSIILDRIDGHAKIYCDYGRLEIGELRGRNNQLNFDYTSKSTIDYINSGTITADYSGFHYSKSRRFNLSKQTIPMLQ